SSRCSRPWWHLLSWKEATMVRAEAPLTCSVAQVDGRVVIHVRGEIDMATAPRLPEALAKSPDGTSLRLDLSDVTFLDSSGIAAVVTAHEDLEPRAGGFAISAV